LISSNAVELLICIKAQVRKTKTEIKNLASRERGKGAQLCRFYQYLNWLRARDVGGRNMLLCSVGTLQRLQIQNVETFPLSLSRGHFLARKLFRFSCGARVGEIEAELQIKKK
jgi:hypothetical protein